MLISFKLLAKGVKTILSLKYLKDKLDTKENGPYFI